MSPVVFCECRVVHIALETSRIPWMCVHACRHVEASHKSVFVKVAPYAAISSRSGGLVLPFVPVIKV